MSDVTYGEERFEAAGGLNLNFQFWRPASPRGVVAICPGFNSHSGYYRWAGEQLADSGLAAYALDLRGRGKSDGERFFLNSFADYTGDLSQFMGVVRSREPGLPVFLYGHSAGGVVSCIYTLSHQSELAGLICTSFAFQVPAPDFAIAALKGLSHVAPHAHVLRLPNEAFSRDPAVVKAMNEDPLIDHETQPTKTVAELARADDRLKRDFPKFTLPLLIMHGTADKATKFSGSQMFYDKASSKDKTLKLYEGHFHDLLSDLDKEQVMTDIKAWIEPRLQG